jgi:DNA helicase HerA-like ATPase
MTAITIGRTPAGGDVRLLLRLANRHGLVTGATGTGKTVTLQRLAEGFSAAGVPVFAADIKGDLSGVGAMGDNASKLGKSALDLGIKWAPRKFPVRLWDLYGEDGMPMRTSVDEMGPLLIARLLELNDVQAGVLNVLFKWSADEKWGFSTLADLSALLSLAFDYRAELCRDYGNVTVASLAAIQRALLTLNAQNGWRMFGEPALDIHDLMRCDEEGRGIINLLTADRLTGEPRLYSTFLLFLLTRLFDTLPECGDLDKPKLVFFFDEAHLLFANAPPKLLETIERLVRLIRSKGVGVYFVTQTQQDVPDAVLAQLGNKFQHTLRAFSPRDLKGVRSIAQTFRLPAGVKAQWVVEKITTMGVGHALASPLQHDGTPAPVQVCRVLPPEGQVGPLSDLERGAITGADPMRATYQDTLQDDAARDAFQARVHPNWRQIPGNEEPDISANAQNPDSGPVSFFRQIADMLGFRRTI